MRSDEVPARCRGAHGAGCWCPAYPDQRLLIRRSHARVLDVSSEGRGLVMRRRAPAVPSCLEGLQMAHDRARCALRLFIHGLRSCSAAVLPTQCDWVSTGTSPAGWVAPQLPSPACPSQLRMSAACAAAAAAHKQPAAATHAPPPCWALASPTPSLLPSSHQSCMHSSSIYSARVGPHTQRLLLLTHTAVQLQPASPSPCPAIRWR